MDEKTTEIICQKQTEYLERNHLRKTPERYEILKAIYTFEGHFTMEDLQKKLTDEIKFHVSRATLYNNVNHLILANLLVRHAFPHASQFEKVYGVRPHLHRICTMCWTVKEKEVENINSMVDTIKHHRFHMSHHVIYIYGICSRCEAALKKKKKKKAETTSNSKKE